MAPNIVIGKRAWTVSSPRGFTIIELMIVVTIVGILATLAVPPTMRLSSKPKGRRVTSGSVFAPRRHRSASGRQGKYPKAFRRWWRPDTCVGCRPTLNGPEYILAEMVDEAEGGMVDVFSGSDLVGTNGVPYNQW